MLNAPICFVSCLPPAFARACILVEYRNNSRIATGVTPCIRFAAPSVTGLDLLNRSFSSDDSPRKLPNEYPATRTWLPVIV